MAFTIRIELHNANSTHYADLARKLAGVNITDVVRGDDGVNYKMPPGEYNYEPSADINNVRQTCAGIAASVVPSYAVYVTQGEVRAWIGLQAAR